MIEKVFTYFLFFCLTAVSIVLLTNIPVVGLFVSSFVLLDTEFFREILLAIVLSLYYLIIVAVYIVFICFAIKYSFEHLELITDMNRRELTDTGRIFRYIVVNLAFLFIAIVLYWYFNILNLRILLLVYICWILGYTASFPLNPNVIEIMTANEMRDYILLKSSINAFIFIVAYCLINYFFF